MSYQAAVEAILRAGHIPAGMELFAAQNKPQMDVIKDWIEESDILPQFVEGRPPAIRRHEGRQPIG